MYFEISFFSLENTVLKITTLLPKEPFAAQKGKKGSHTSPLSLSIFSVETAHKLTEKRSCL